MTEDSLGGTEARVIKSLDELPAEMRELAHRGLQEEKDRDMDPGEFYADTQGEEPEIDWIPKIRVYAVDNLNSGGKIVETRKFYLREPVIVQEQQILRMLRQSTIDLGDFDFDISDAKGSVKAIGARIAKEVGDINNVLFLLEDSVSRFFAIILIEEGKTLEDRDLAATEVFLRYNMTWAQQVEVMSDFFGYVKEDLVEKIKATLGKRLKKIYQKMQAQKKGSPPKARG